jgi:hypothetical protein
VVERLRNQLTGTFSNLPGTVDRAYPYILAGIYSTFADVLGSATRMQRHQVAGPLPMPSAAFPAPSPAPLPMSPLPLPISPPAPSGAVVGWDWVVGGCMAGAWAWEEFWPWAARPKASGARNNKEKRVLINYLL